MCHTQAVRTFPGLRLAGLALSGLLGVVTASALALGSVAVPSAAEPASLSVELATDVPVAAAAVVLADEPAGRREEAVDRSGSRPELDLTDDLAADRARLLTKQSKAIKKKVAAIEAAERRRIELLGYDPSVTDPREIARQMMRNKYGWGETQFQCYDAIIMRESRWIHTADNPTSSAYGIPQALPGSKMASAGADWRTNPATQIKWGLGYIKERYGTPCQGWAFKRAHGWY